MKHRFDTIISLPVPRKDVSGFLLQCRPLFKERGKLHPEMQRAGLGGWFRRYRDTAVMLEPKERERSEALTTSKHKQPGAGKQFTSRSSTGEERTTHSKLLGSTWALPRSNGSPSVYRSGVFFLFDISVNKVANDHTREASEGFRTSSAPLAPVCPAGLPARQLQGGGGGSGRAFLPGVCTGPGGHDDHGCCGPASFMRQTQAVPLKRGSPIRRPGWVIREKQGAGERQLCSASGVCVCV